jgi:oligosaccharide reducing-end xylanase
MTGSSERPFGVLSRTFCRALSIVVLSACSSSVDLLGYDLVDAGAPDADASSTDADAMAEGGAGGTPSEDPTLIPLTPPASYPNLFRDLLGKTEQEITDKINAAFNRLFYGADDEVIYYYQVGNDRAEIRDILHGDVRTEGIGFGMLITVQLDKKAEFDRLWRYAKAVKASSGADEGYFDSSCDTLDMSTRLCVDPFGYQQFTMALIFAHGRWGSDGAIDYEKDALALLDVMRHKEQQNADPLANSTNTFDTETKLVFDEPRRLVIHTRPSLEMPGYYELWAQATGDDFWREAAMAARSFLAMVANPSTGLMPLRVRFDGSAMDGWNYFGPEAYRTHLNVTLDRIWVDNSRWPVDQSNLVLGFFAGVSTTGTSYELDGTPIDPMPELALVYSNGIAAASSTRADRADFVQAVWNLAPPSGPPRYYSGLLHLLALLVLGGRMHVI